MLAQAKKHLRPTLLETAAAAGVIIKVVHFGQPLAEQGPFDVLLHKIRRKGAAACALHWAAGWPTKPSSDAVQQCKILRGAFCVSPPSTDVLRHTGRQ